MVNRGHLKQRRDTQRGHHHADGEILQPAHPLSLMPARLPDTGGDAKGGLLPAMLVDISSPFLGGQGQVGFCKPGQWKNARSGVRSRAFRSTGGMEIPTPPAPALRSARLAAQSTNVKSQSVSVRRARLSLGL